VVALKTRPTMVTVSIAAIGGSTPTQESDMTDADLRKIALDTLDYADRTGFEWKEIIWAMRAAVDKVEAERDQLRAALEEALEWGDEGWSYASEYMREKWDCDGQRSRIADAIDGGPRPGWFERVAADVEEKTKDRPAWRRSARVNADLERLKGDEDDG
jgi:hypothetical protein